MTKCPGARPAQRWCDYTDAPVLSREAPPGPVPMWGAGSAEHVTVLGLRADEDKRIAKINSRSFFAEGASKSCSIHTQPPGEHPCFPLADWGFDAVAVRNFWQERDFDLSGPDHAGNCVFCFMKGTRSLAKTACAADPARRADTPSDIRWWIKMEERYQREVAARNGEGTTRFGFFGVSGPTFAKIARGNAPDLSRYATGAPACDCTD